MGEEKLEACEPVSTTSRHNPLIISGSQGRAGLEEMPKSQITRPFIDSKWYIMRDLKRPNAKLLSYKRLDKSGFRVFIPTEKKMVIKNGKRKSETKYILYNLFFVYGERGPLDKEVNSENTLQYLYKRGAGYCVPTTVPNNEMERFIHAVEGTDDPRYFLPSDLLPSMIGKLVHITAGPLAGYEGHLLKAVGRAKKRLIVELPGILAAGVEVKPEHIMEITKVISK